MGSTTLSRHVVWRDLVINNKETNIGLELGLVVEMNLVELGLVVDICRCGGTRTGGGYMLQVNSDWRDGGGYVVAYMDSDWR